MDKIQLDEFVTRYVSMWHEPNPARREEIVRSLWAEDAENYTRKFVVRGMGEILERVTRAHEEWIASKGFMFRPAGNSDTHNHLVKFFWEMLPRNGGPLEARGLDIFVLREDGRIRSLYQFPEALSLAYTA